MPLHTMNQDLYIPPPMNCWLVRRQTQQSNEEYVAHSEATALMMWDYMQRDVLAHGPTPVRMALVWRPESGQERTVASLDVDDRI